MVYVPDALVALILLELAVVLFGITMGLANEFANNGDYLSKLNQTGIKVAKGGVLALCITGIGFLLYGAVLLLL